MGETDQTLTQQQPISEADTPAWLEVEREKRYGCGPAADRKCLQKKEPATLLRNLDKEDILQ